MIDRYDLRLDYDSHPNYNKVRTLSFSSTFSFLLLFLFSTIKTIIFTLFGKLYPKVPSGKSKIYDNFYKAGVYALNDKQIVSQINNDIKDTISVHIKNVKKIDPSARTLSNCVEGFRRKQNPVLFDKRYFKDLMEIKGDEGARVLIKKHPEIFFNLTVLDEGTIKDIDNADQYYEFLNNE